MNEVYEDIIKVGQNISEFVAELLQFASACEFGATLENMIRNQLV